MVLPRSLREQAGVAEGTLMKVDWKDGQFFIIPQFTIDRPAVTQAKQSRKQILKELAAAVDDLRQDAKEKGLANLSASKINRAVTTMRRNLSPRIQGLVERVDATGTSFGRRHDPDIDGFRPEDRWYERNCRSPIGFATICLRAV